ncbi:MAG TPA: hypothetical protein VHV83_06145 [Armatimonadota bacterium]|nr:hypothetical protein [Armatimonadota bacterium]
MSISHIVHVLMLSMLGLPLTVLRTPALPLAPATAYPLHRNIMATLFWIGEEATEQNTFITNIQSCWDERWVEHYGGVDTPEQRNGYLPADFTPHENPFYIALPYNDFGDDGKRKANAQRVIPWAGEKQWGERESMCKNQWVRISKGDKVVYAQWEDSGPFIYDDIDYVFGTAEPLNQQNQHAGIDLSPAVHNYLGLHGLDRVDWQFVPASSVPDGPWKTIITSSQITWE